jgi:formate dehydrogenase subunit gamma
MIKRHNVISIFLHWFNAACWFLLLFTGLGLINNPDLDPVGGWWPSLMRSIFGSGENLLVFHWGCGLVWAGVFLIYCIAAGKDEVYPFLKEIFTFSIPRDIMWIIKKGIQMTLGYGMLKRLGFEPRIPDQGFYNVGQKLFAIPAIFGGCLITLTGIIMMVSKYIIMPVVIVQWSILLHFITVGAVFAGLLVHIFMASLASGELPALISMFTGKVPEEYAEHHHKLWYDQVKEEEGL